MVKIINNNWSPIPWGWGGGCCCNGNNGMNKMFGYMMLFSMINNMSNSFRNYVTSPQQGMYPYVNMNGSFYPGLSLSGGGNSYEDYLNNMNKTQDDNDYKQLKEAWPEFKFTNIGGKYQATFKDDRTVHLSGDTVEDLMNEIYSYADENPDKFKAKPKPETHVSPAEETVQEEISEQEEQETVIQEVAPPPQNAPADDEGSEISADDEAVAPTADDNGSDSTYNTDVQKNVRAWYERNDYTIKNNGKACAQLRVTSDGLAQDAELCIPSGTNKGVWRFRCENNNTANIGYFNTSNGHISYNGDSTITTIERWYECNSNEYSKNGNKIQTNSNKYKTYYTKYENDILYVNIGDKNKEDWIPLEQFASMR